MAWCNLGVFTFHFDVGGSKKMKKIARRLSPLGGRAFYIGLLAVLVVAALGAYLIGDQTVGAQKNAEFIMSDLPARPDRLAIALDLRSAHDVAAFGGSGLADDAATLRGSRATAKEGFQVRADLDRAHSIIKQLDCTTVEGDVTGRTFGPGVYCLPSMRLVGQMTLDGMGSADAQFVFIVKGPIEAERGASFQLQNGAAAENVYFWGKETATVAEGVTFAGTILARGDVTVGAGSDIKGRTLSVDGKVTLDGESVSTGAGFGILEICKHEVPYDGVPGLANRIFRFRVAGNVYTAPVGGCTGQIKLATGNVLIEELNDGTLIPSGNWEGRFELINVTTEPANALGPVSFPARTATVFVREGGVNNMTIARFFNQFAITGVIEICKRAAPIGTGPNANQPDPDVQGFFDYTIDAIPNTGFTVPAGFCSGPLTVTQVTTPQPSPSNPPAFTMVGVTEIAHPGFQWVSVSTFPTGRLGNVFANQGMVNSQACSNHGPTLPFNPGCLVPNPGGAYVAVIVYEGGAGNQTTVNFFNRSRPGRVKVCKTAGPGIPINTRFVFEVRGREASNPFPGDPLPGVDVVRNIVVGAGPASQGGFCDFVAGTFIVGTHVLVREISVLPPIPAVAERPQQDAQAAVPAGTGPESTQAAIVGPSAQHEIRSTGWSFTSVASPIGDGQMFKSGASNRSTGDLASRVIDENLLVASINGLAAVARSRPADDAPTTGVNPQAAIITTTDESDRAIVFPDLSNLPTPGQTPVPGLPFGAKPHGVGYFGNDRALMSDWGGGRVFEVQISTASLLSTINTAPAGYDGAGSIAISPTLTTALAMGGVPSGSVLYKIQGPFGPGSTITALAMPGSINHYQTQAIVFNNAGRAFVYHTNGISVLDPPYTAIAFTIPVPNAGDGINSLGSGAIAITPDGNTLLVTDLATNVVRIFQAPFSAASVPALLTIPGGVRLDGIMVNPDGTRAIVVSARAYHAAAILAPFSAASTVQNIPLPATGNGNGFEDVGISADGSVAVLAGGGLRASGNDPGGPFPPVVVRAPFGSSSVTQNLPLVGNPGRGNGGVRFLPPNLAPGLTINKTAPGTVASGANLTYTINYGNTGKVAATNVVISDPVPAGTTFVSATGGGTLVAGNVVWNIGTLNPGQTGSVTFTVTVNLPAGSTVLNNNYFIDADIVPPVIGPPVTTRVEAPPPLTIGKTAPGTVASGANLTYTINYSNNSAVNVPNVVITDPLPAGTTFVSATGGGTYIAPNVVWNIGTVNAMTSGSVSFTVTVNLPGGSTVTNNNYTIRSGDGEPNGGPPVITTVSEPILRVTKGAADTVYTGENLTYTLNYSNIGTAAANNVVISDPVPAGTTFVSATAGGTLVAGNVVWNIGTVNAGTGGSVSFTVNVTAPGGSTIVNSGYNIRGDGVPPYTGEPVTTRVLEPPPIWPPHICVSRIRLDGSATGPFPPGPVTVQGITVNPNPSRTQRAVVFVARAGITEIEFANFICRETLLKVCKIAGPGVQPGTPFTFSLSIDSLGGLFAPPSSIAVAPLTVQAGPSGQGGFCAFAQGPYPQATPTTPPVGTFYSGQTVYVTEGGTTPVTGITSPTNNTLVPCDPVSPRCRGIVLANPGGFNEITFTNQVAPAPGERTMFDFDGDGRTDISVTRHSGSSTWYQLRSGGGYTFTQFDLGQTGDVIVPADYNGDGKTEAGVFRPSTGDWWVLTESETVAVAMNAGVAGDIPLPSDYTGDGKADFVLYRPSTSQWLRYENGSSNTSHMAFGASGDKPLLGDFDGDGKADPAIFRASSGTFWYAASSQGDAHRASQWGMNGDVPAVGDYDGDGKTDFAIFRPSNGEWYILNSSDGSMTGLQWGMNGDKPIVADYDGDGKADVAVFRPSNGTWYIIKSGSGFQGFVWGVSTDIPTPAAYVP
jgi:uncharacterized repeat protein (TIGR01451 family)